MLFPALLLSPAYFVSEAKWRAAEEKAIRAENGWLAVAGLHWLDDRLATVGSGRDCDIRLDAVTLQAGTVTLTGGRVWFSSAASDVRVDGRRVDGIVELRSDASPHPSQLRIDDDTLTVIQRGKRVGIRVVDPHSSRRVAFKGLRWYPIDARYRIEARFVPYAKPKTLLITNVLGDVREAPCKGYAEFRLGGRTCRLDAEDQGGSCFFNFADRTNNRTTYGAGRFLEAPKPKGGKVILDFNRATNPPCAFTDFATCPLPPAQNKLPVEIRAGALNGHTE